MELFEAINGRRSIRKYTNAPVDDKKINAILEAGRWAPSWANSQCSRFVVVRDAKIRAALGDTLAKIVLPDGKEMLQPSVAAINTVPVVIVVCAEIGVSGSKPGAGTEGPNYVTDKGDWFMYDAGLATQNMVLAAYAQGLGTVILGWFDPAKVEKIVNVPKGYRVVSMFPVGVPAQEGKAPPRKELAELVIKDKFGK
jgi:nitroreductase